MNKISDVYDTTYDDYYINQAYNQYGTGSNEIHTYFRGKPYQRGYNFFYNFSKKYALPFLKYFGKKAFNYGKNVVEDVIKGNDPKSALKRNLKTSVNETIDDAKKMLNKQTGSRRRRKTKRKSKKKPIRKSKPKKSIKKKRSKKKKISKKRKSRKRKRRVKNIFDHV